MSNDSITSRRRLIGATKIVGILLLVTKAESIQQFKEPESIKVQVERDCLEMDRVVKRESGSERVDMLSQTNVAMQKTAEKVNATLSLCSIFLRVVDYFFESAVSAFDSGAKTFAALPLAAADFGQS